MKNTRRGFIVPLLLVIIALFLVGGGAYVVKQKKEAIEPVKESPVVEITSTTQGTSTTPEGQSVATIKTTTVSAPGIASISPSLGPVGTVVKMLGSFPMGTGVNFGTDSVGQAATDMDSFTFIVPSSFRVYGLGPPSTPVFPNEYSISLIASSDSISRGYGNGNSIKFTVTPTPAPVVDPSAPIVTSINPSTMTATVETNATIYGSNFRSTNMIAIIGSGIVTSLAPTNVSADGKTLRFVFPSTLTSPALYTVEVYDTGSVQDYTKSGYAHSFSSSVVVTLVSPYVPNVTSVSPISASVGDTVTVSGKNFYSDTRVYVGTYLPGTSNGSAPITPSAYTDTSLTFIIPSDMKPAQYVLAVAGSSGRRSNEIRFTVVAK